MLLAITYPETISTVRNSTGSTLLYSFVFFAAFQLAQTEKVLDDTDKKVLLHFFGHGPAN